MIPLTADEPPGNAPWHTLLVLKPVDEKKETYIRVGITEDIDYGAIRRREIGKQPTRSWELYEYLRAISRIRSITLV
jgi:hypothetical protein